jgi:hypothetical protein
MANDQPGKMRSQTRKGWSWFESGFDAGFEPGFDAGFDADGADQDGAAAGYDLDAGRELRLSFARCFAGPEGEKVLAHLRALTLDRALGPDASDAMLRHLEGQRQLVTHILAQIERGRQGG